MMKSLDDSHGKGDASAELKRARMEVARQEEVVGYLFRRNKHLANIVAEFYQKAVAEQNGNFVPDQNVNYETTLMKLESIIREYVKYKTAFTGKSIELTKSKSESNLSGFNMVTPIRNFSPVHDRFDASKEKPEEWNKSIVENRDRI